MGTSVLEILVHFVPFDILCVWMCELCPGFQVWMAQFYTVLMGEDRAASTPNICEF